MTNKSDSRLSGGDQSALAGDHIDQALAEARADIKALQKKQSYPVYRVGVVRIYKGSPTYGEQLDALVAEGVEPDKVFFYCPKRETRRSAMGYLRILARDGDTLLMWHPRVISPNKMNFLRFEVEMEQESGVTVRTLNPWGRART